MALIDPDCVGVIFKLCVCVWNRLNLREHHVCGKSMFAERVQKISEHVKTIRQHFRENGPNYFNFGLPYTILLDA